MDMVGAFVAGGLVASAQRKDGSSRQQRKIGIRLAIDILVVRGSVLFGHIKG